MGRHGQLLIRELKFDALTPGATLLASIHDQHWGPTSNSFDLYVIDGLKIRFADRDEEGCGRAHER
jgi:hypothetical protein